MEWIHADVLKGNSDFLIEQLARGYILPRFSVVKKIEEGSSHLQLSKIFSTSVYDKNGNKNITLNPESDDDRVSYYNSYDLHFQVPSQICFTFFMEVFRAKKIDYEILYKWLQNTWFGDETIKVYNGYSRNVIIADYLSAPLKLFFTELEKYINPTQGEVPNFVCALDSLTLKVEYIIRLLCEEHFNIPTSYIREDGLVEEKTFTALISDLIKEIENHPKLEPQMKELLLDDMIFVDFVMNSKAGLNIRNRIAHAHLDIEEYEPRKILHVLNVILRISKIIKPQKKTQKIDNQ